jgi:hypothetical protein
LKGVSFKSWYLDWWETFGNYFIKAEYCANWFPYAPDCDYVAGGLEEICVKEFYLDWLSGDALKSFPTNLSHRRKRDMLLRGVPL